jgi:DNA gyrase subunit B
VRGVADFFRAAFDGLTRGGTDDGELEAPPAFDELPAPPHDVLTGKPWISSRPRAPRERALMIDNIRSNPRGSVGELERAAALGTLLEGAMSFALDDAVDGNCDWIDIRLLADGSAMVTHGGPGYAPDRAARAMQRWPWLRRSPDGEVVLTRNLAAPIVTCALSHWCRLEIRRREGTYRQAFYRGEPEHAMTRSAPDKLQDTHTRVHFRPDPLLFGQLGFSVDDLYMRGLGFSVELQGIELRIHDERTVAAPLVMVGAG